MYWATGILGLILAVAPWIFNYSSHMTATWTSLVIGILTIVVSFVEGVQTDGQRWEYWAAGLLGIVAIVAPFVLGFSTYNIAMWSSVVLGILIAIFSGTRLGSGGFRT